MSTTTAPRLKTKYETEIREALRAQLGVQNVMQIPKIDKIVVNMGIVTKSKTSIASFKLRENQAIGCKVTLRGDRMWEFFDRLVSVAIPRIRDFRGLPAWSWDGRGNYTFGLAEQTMFPEIEYDKVDSPQGMDITIVTTATTDEDGKALLEAFGFPFKRGKDAGAKPKKVVRRRGPGAPGAKGKK